MLMVGNHSPPHSHSPWSGLTQSCKGHGAPGYRFFLGGLQIPTKEAPVAGLNEVTLQEFLRHGNMENWSCGSMIHHALMGMFHCYLKLPQGKIIETAVTIAQPEGV